MSSKPTAKEVTPEIIEHWKKQFGKITRYKTTDGKVVYFRSPTRAEVAASQAAREESEGVTANEVLAKAILLGGDPEVCTENKYLFGLAKHLAKVFEKVEGETEEL